MWYDGPGHSRCIDLSNHPEHTQPAEVFSSFLPGQHLCKEGENDGHSTSYPATNRENGKVSGSEVEIELKPGQKQSFIHFYLMHGYIHDCLYMLCLNHSVCSLLSCGLLSLKLKRDKSDTGIENAISLNVQSARTFSASSLNCSLVCFPLK